jgi:Raf kinase inhibitor-like YbhB/YbcL family protein
LTACTLQTSSPEVDAMERSGNVRTGLVQEPMKIKSPEFQEGMLMPRKYSCQGDDINPPLEFSGIPANTKSLVLIMDDPDAPMGTWDHWIMFNIPVVSKIGEDSVPAGALEGMNSWGNTGYGGPCPPSGTHRYFFKLYALDKSLGIEEGSSKMLVEDMMKGHILAEARLIGVYKKS